MTTTRRLSKAYNARISRLDALLRTQAEFRRRTTIKRVEALIANDPA